MKKYLLVLVISITAGLTGSLFGQNRFWVASSASNWNNTANWSTTSGGPGGASVPGSTEVAIFNANGAGNCNLDIAPTVGGMTVNGYTGTINFQGNNLTTTGTNQFTTGTLTPGTTASLVLNTTSSTTFSGTTISVNLTGSTGRLLLNGSTFNGTVNVTKTDAINDFGSGNNVFNGAVTLTNAGDAYLILGNINRDQFNSTVTFNNNGGSRIYFAHNHGGQTTTFANDVILNSNKSGGTDAWSYLICEGNNTAVSFGGNVTINSAGTLQSNQRILQGSGTQATYAGTLTINLTNTNASTSINMGAVGTSTFNGNIVVSSTGGANGIYFNNSASASSTLSASRTITIGGSGFSTGILSLSRFTQTGSTPQALTLTGTAILTVGPNSDFGGDVSFTSPNINLNGCTYRGTASIEKTGILDNASTGGNVFQSTTTITHSGAGGEFYLGAANADTFNGVTTFNNTGGYRIRIAHNHAGQTTQFNNTVTLNANKSSGTDQWAFLIAENNLSNVSFAGALNINVMGSLRSDIRFLNGPGSIGTFNGPVTVNIPNNNASTTVYLSTNGAATFADNIIVSNSGGSNGVFFSTGASGTSVLAAGKTITIGAGGFSSGSLSLARFTQSGSTAQALALTGTALLVVGPNSQFSGDVNFSAPRLFLNGCTYAGTATLEKNGAGNDDGLGGNDFQGITAITNSGSGYLLLGNTNADQFDAATTFNVTGSGRFHFAQNHTNQTTTFASSLVMNINKSAAVDQWGILFCEGANTAVNFGGTLTIQNSGTFESDNRFLNGIGSTAVYNGDVNIIITNSNPATQVLMGTNGTSTYNANIIVNNTGGSSGVTFNNNASASSTLSGNISSGGFNSGQLNLYRFAQLGATPQTLTLTNAGTILRIGPGSSFDGDVTFTAPRLLLNGAIYNGAAVLEKNSTIDDAGQGGNIFNGSTTLTDSGSGYLLTANTSPDIFNGDLTVTNSGSNYIYLAHAVTGNQFNGNVVLNNSGSALGIRFCLGLSADATFNAGTNKTISIAGSGFSTGELSLRRFTQTGTSAQTLTLTGSNTLLILGPNSEFNGNVTFTAPRIFLNGTRYNGTAYLEKTGTNNDDGIGGNTFNGTATLVNSGSNYLLTGSTNPDIFNGTLIIQNNSSSTIRLADNSTGNQFNQNIELNSTSGGGIFFGANANGTSTLAAGKTIAVGSSGFITGDIRLIRFTQVGPTPQSLNLGGIALLTLGPASSFGGNVDFRSPQLLLNGTTFSGTSYLEKKGAVDNYSNGGNTFVGSTTLVDSGGGYLAMAFSSPDVFQSDLTVTNTGSNIIYLANNVAGNQFNGNITFNSTLGSNGIYIGNNATASATLGTGASLLTGGLGFSSGELRLRRLTQIGASPQTLTLTGTALVRIGPSTTFNGSVDFRSPQIALDGATYNGTTYLEKTGALNNDSSGGNSFLGSSTTIVNSGTGFFRFALSTLDTFGSGDLILVNSGTSTIRLADNVPGSVFNGNIFVNSTAGGGIYFSESAGGTATLAAGKSIAVGTSGFSIGDLRLRRFTQSDAATPQTLLMTGTSSLVLGPSIAFSGNADFRAPQVFLNGGTFNGPALIEKTGATDNTGAGGMTFNATTSLRLSGSGFFRTNGGNTFNGSTSLINIGTNSIWGELSSGSAYNGDLTLTNTSTGTIRIAFNGTNTFGGNIEVNNTGTGTIIFGESAGTSSLASGKSISVGASGFPSGTLALNRFTQNGTTAQTLNLTGTAVLRLVSSTFNGNFTAVSPAIFLDVNTFNGSTNSITKTGSTTENSNGGNLFSAGTTTTLVNAGTGIFRLANSVGDDFSGDITFTQTAGLIQPAYLATSTFRGNVTVNSTSPIVFGTAGGITTFTGTAAQTIGKTGTASPVFNRMVINKSSGSVTFNTDATVGVSATFTSGIVNTTAVNLLNFVDNATTTGASNASFVDGPVRKTGNDAFTFPIGDNGFYRPAGISAPTSTAHFFTAQYFNTDHGLGSAGDPSFISVTKCEYWQIDRNTGAASNVSVTLSWQEASCVPGYITDPATLRVARWNGASWVNHGNGGTTGTATNGTIVTSSAVTSFSPFTLASASLANPLPVELTWFKASVTSHGTGLLQWRTESELNNDRFEIQRSENGTEFTTIGTVNGAGTSNKAHEYQFEDQGVTLDRAYYRLKQVDFNGDFEYSQIVSLDFTGTEISTTRFMIAPNPVNRGSVATFKSGAANVRQTVTIFNGLNQAVKKYSAVDSFSTDDLTPGIYIVKNQAGEIFRLVVK